MHNPRHSRIRRSLIPLTVLFGTASLGASPVAEAQGVPPPPSSYSQAAETPLDLHMKEALRSDVDKVVVYSGRGVADDDVSGTYGKATEGLVGGIDAGSRIGTIDTEIGPVPVYFPIPGTALPGAIFGGIRGLTRREMQELRDKLTEQLEDTDNSPLKHEGLALDVFRSMQRLPTLDSYLFSPKLDVPEDTDAVLSVAFDDLSIDVQGRDAVITTSATATLHRLRDGQNIYRTTIHYQDRDSLGEWAEDDNALLRQYVNYARYYLGREIAADIFARAVLEHELRPVETGSATRARKDELKFESESMLPTLAWELTLNGDPYGGWSQTITEADIRYDVEIFDNRQLVYDARDVTDPTHTLEWELEPCQTYRWSVRPTYNVDGKIRVGEWMRFPPEVDEDEEEDAEATKAPKGKGILGRKASEAPAYIQDFARLEIACSR